MNFEKVIYEVVTLYPFEGLIRVTDDKGEKSDLIVSLEEHKNLLKEIKRGNKLEIEVNGWRIRSIRKMSMGLNKSN